MSDSKHSMIMRSKKKLMNGMPEPPNFPEDDIDENGNVTGLIDYECDEEFDENVSK